jgi:hypothetical protein
VNESEWLSSTDPSRMLAYLTAMNSAVGVGESPYPVPHTSDRKPRLFACACCRAVWNLLTDPRSRKAVEVAERCADGEVERLEVPWLDWRDGTRDVPDWLREWSPCASNPTEAARRCCNNPTLAAAQAALLRDVVGNPWRPVVPERAYLTDATARARVSAAAHAAWEGGPRGRQGDELYRRAVDGMVFRQTWLTPTVLRIARGVYADRDWVALPVLADALQEAGCEDEQVLGHLRGPGPHCRGCFVLDLLLGKS